MDSSLRRPTAKSYDAVFGTVRKTDAVNGTVPKTDAVNGTVPKTAGCFGNGSKNCRCFWWHHPVFVVGFASALTLRSLISRSRSAGTRLADDRDAGIWRAGDE